MFFFIFGNKSRSFLCQHFYFSINPSLKHNFWLWLISLWIHSNPILVFEAHFKILFWINICEPFWFVCVDTYCYFGHTNVIKCHSALIPWIIVMSMLLDESYTVSPAVLDNYRWITPECSKWIKEFCQLTLASRFSIIVIVSWSSICTYIEQSHFPYELGTSDFLLLFGNRWVVFFIA